MHRKHHIINKKSLRGIRPRHCPPSPRGVKYIVVTQDTSSTLCSERRDEYLFGRTKTGGLGQVSTKTKHEKKILAAEVKNRTLKFTGPICTYQVQSSVLRFATVESLFLLFVYTFD